jgi:hypothetical protein
MTLSDIENYLKLLEWGAFAAIGALVIGIICLILLINVWSDLRQIKQAMGIDQAPQRAATHAQEVPLP